MDDNNPPPKHVPNDAERKPDDDHIVDEAAVAMQRKAEKDANPLAPPINNGAGA